MFKVAFSLYPKQQRGIWVIRKANTIRNSETLSILQWGINLSLHYSTCWFWFFCYAHQNGSLAGQKLRRFGSCLGFSSRVKCRAEPLLLSSHSQIPIPLRTLHPPCIDSSSSFFSSGNFTPLSLFSFLILFLDFFLSNIRLIDKWRVLAVCVFSAVLRLIVLVRTEFLVSVQVQGG